MKMVDPEHEAWKLSRRASEAFAEALLNPPAPSEALREAAARYKAQCTDTAL